MPDVGNLNIEITSNASEASRGLYNVADALSRIKAAVPNNGIGLSKVATELNKFAKQINQAKATNAVLQNIANFGKGLKDVTSAIKATSKDFDTSKITGAIDAIKASVGDGIKLGQSGTQLKNLKDALGGDWNTEKAQQAGEALKFIAEGARSLTGTNLGTIAKNVSAVAKALDEYATASEHMISAVGGNKQSMSSVWETVEDATPKGKSRLPVNLQFHGWREDMAGFSESVKAIEPVSEKIKDIISQIQITDAAVNKIVQKVDETGSKFNSIVSADAMTSPIERISETARQGATNVNYFGNAIDTVLPKVNAMSSAEMIEAGNARLAAMSERELKVALADANGELKKISTNSVADGMMNVGTIVERVNIQLHETGDIVTSVIVPAFHEMYQIWSKMAYEFNMFQHATRLMAGESPMLLGAGKSPLLLGTGEMTEPNKFLSLWRDTGEQFRTDWVYFVSDVAEQWRAAWSPDWIMGGWTPPASMASFALGAGESPLLLGTGEMTEPEKFLSIWRDTGEQWKQDWAYYSKEAAEEMARNFKPNWIMDDTWKEKMYQNMVNMYNEFGWFKQAGPMLPAGQEPLRLYSGFEELEERRKVNSQLDFGDVDGAVDGVKVVGTVVQDTAEKVEEAKVSVDDFYNSLNKIDLLKQLRETLTKDLGKGILSGQWDDKKIISTEIRIQSLTEQIHKLEDAERAASDEAINMAKAKIGEYMDKTEIELLTEKLNGMTDAVARRYAAGKINEEQFAREIASMQKLRDKIEELQEAEAAASSFTGRIKGAFDALGKGIKKLFPTITGMIGRFAQIAKYRVLRTVLKHITSGFTEGVQNVYNYSKIVGTSLAPAMDAAATSLQQMKNSVGAAVAPAIQALVPVLQTAVNWFISLVNWANQFLALMMGQKTWTRALPEAAEAFESQKKKAKGAHDAMKDLLADWDELNIIQSKNSGGSGSSSGHTEEEYRNMFEEVSQFDKSVRDTIAFIDEHLGGIVGLLKKAGLVLLGWKFSKAFDGFLGTLGKLVAGGALITLGVEFAYGAGFDAGSKGYFDGKDITRAIVGSIATAIGGTLVATSLGLSGALGFGIGLTIGIISTLVGYLVGQTDHLDKLKWGNKELTPEQLEEYVQSKFKFDVLGEINMLGVNIDNRKQAKEELEKSVNDFTTKLTLAKIKVGVGADDSGTAIEEAAESAKTVIKEVEDYIKVQEETLAVTLSVAPITDAEGKDISKDILSHITVADTTLKKYMNDIGREIAAAIDAGQKAKWDEDTSQMALDLMERQRKIVQSAEEYSKEVQFNVEMKLNLKDLTRDNVEDIQKREQEIIEQHREKFMQDRQSAAEGYQLLYGYAMASVEDAIKQGKSKEEIQKLKDAASAYEKLLEEYLSPKANEAAWQKKLAETKKGMGKEWQEALTGVYGLNEFDRYLDVSKYGATHFRSSSEEFAENVNKALQTSDPVGKASEAIKQYFTDSQNRLPDYVKDAMATYGLSMWDVSSETSKTKLVAFLKDKMGDENAMKVLQSVGATKNDVEKYLIKLWGTKIDPKLYEGDKTDFEKFSDDFTGFWQQFFKYNPPETDLPIKANPSLEGLEDYTLSDHVAVDDIEQFVNTGELPVDVPAALTIDEEGISDLTHQAEIIAPDGVPIKVKPYFEEKSAKEQILDGLGLGNINLNNRKVLHNEDGTISTERSFSFWDEDEKKEILIPQVVDGVLLSMEEAIEHYYKTGEHFGKFNTYQEADAYAVDLHNRDEWFYGIKEDIEEAMEDGLLDATERIGMYDRWGSDKVDAMLEYLKTNSDGSLGRGVPAKVAQMGAAGVVGGNRSVSDVGWGKGATNEAQPVEIDFTGMTASVQKGSQEANRDVVDGLAAVVLGLQRLLGKEWNINITPSTALGRTVGRSNSDLEAVTGYYNGGGN